MNFKPGRSHFIFIVFIGIFLLCLIPPKNYNSKYPLNIVGPYGDIESYHPKVLNFDKPWNGYKYWMSYTPYPQGDDYKENPCIAVSNDLIHWDLPDDFSSNPLDEPEGRKNGKVYNSDAHIVYNTDLDRLECYWRFVNDQEVIIYRRYTTDGKAWTPKEVAYYCKDREIADCISPAILYDNGTYKMWYVEHSGIVKYAESADGLQWEPVSYVNLNYEESLLTWHLDVIKTQKGYEMVVVAFTEWGRRNDMNLYYSSSEDGINWEIAKTILKPQVKSYNWDNRGIYRSSFIYEDGIYYVFYGGTNKESHHGIGLVWGRDIFHLTRHKINYSGENALEKFNEMIDKEN